LLTHIVSSVRKRHPLCLPGAPGITTRLPNSTQRGTAGFKLGKRWSDIQCTWSQ